MKTNLLVFTSLLLAYCVFLIPLPGWAIFARPELPLLCYLYWVLSMPERFGVFIGFIIALSQDLFTGALLGTHIMGYSIAIVVFSQMYQQIRVHSPWQQAMLLMPLLLIERITVMVVMYMTMPNIAISWSYAVLPALIGVLLWPWLMLFLRGLRRRFFILNPI